MYASGVDGSKRVTLHVPVTTEDSEKLTYDFSRAILNQHPEEACTVELLQQPIHHGAGVGA